MMPAAIRVFIVDDHPFVREWLINLLGLEPDIEVIGEAGDADEAMAAIERGAPNVVVVDLSLKRGSGLDVIKAVHARLPDTKSLVLSMHEEIGDVEKALRAGARGYVMKSESTSQIVLAIRTVHEGGLYAAATVLSNLAERLVRRVPEADTPSPETLSERELDVFRRLGQGHSTRRIAGDLSLNLKTVQTYCARIKEKLGLDSASALVQAAVRWQERERH